MFTGNGGNYGNTGGFSHCQNGTTGGSNATFGGRSVKGTAAAATGLRRLPSMNSAIILPMPNSLTKAPPLFRRSATLSSAHWPSIGSDNSFPYLTAAPTMSSSRYSGGGMSLSYHQDWFSSSSLARPTFDINNSSLASSSYTPQRYSSSDRINCLSSQYSGGSSKYSLPSSSYATTIPASSYAKNNSFASSTLGPSTTIGTPLRSASYASLGIGLGERLRTGTGGSGTNVATSTTIGANRRRNGGTTPSSYGGTGIGSSSLLMSTSLYGGIGGRHHSPTITSSLDRDVDNHFYSRHSVGREIRKNSASSRPSPLASSGYSKSAEYSPPQIPKAKIVEEDKITEKSPLNLNELKPKEMVEEKKEMKRSETPKIILVSDGEEKGRNNSAKMSPKGIKRSSGPKMLPEGTKRSSGPKMLPEDTKRSASPFDGDLANMERMAATNSSRSSSRSSISPSSLKQSKSPSPQLAAENLERKKSITLVEKLDEKKKELWNGGGGQKVEFPPSKEKSPVFSQLEKMIKLAAFDQKKFQKQVRVAAGLELEEAKEEMKKEEEGKTIKAKSRSRSKLPETRNDAPKDGNAQKSTNALSRNNSPYAQPEVAKEEENKLTNERKGSRRKSASKSRSPSPHPPKRSLSPSMINNGLEAVVGGAKGKRAARRTRTVDNVMDELKNVLGQRRVVGSNEDEEANRRSSRSRSRSRQRADGGEFGQQELGKNSSRLRLPLLLVTSPSMGDADEDSQHIDSVADAQMTLKLGENEGGGGDSEGESATASYSDEEEFSDEEYSDEDEDYTDEEEWESDWDVDEATVCRTLQIAGLQGGYESDFELPFELDKSKEKAAGGGGRLPQGNALPPPIFTASISYDGMSSDSWAATSARSYSDEGTGSWAGYSGPGDDVEVGFTLVQRAAMRDSDDEEFTTTNGSYTSSSGTYNSMNGSSFDEDEDEEEEEVEMDHRSQRSYTRSRSMDDRSISRSHRSSSSSSSSSSSGEEAQSVHSGDEEEILAKEEPKLIMLMPKEAQEIEQEEEMDHIESAQIIDEAESMVEIGRQLKEGGGKEDGADGKEFYREATYVRAQNESLSTELTNFLPGTAKPKMDFAKKAVVQGMKERKAKAAEGAKTMQAPTEAELRKKKEEEKKTKEEEEKRKADEKKNEEEKKKAEEKKKEEEKRKADDKRKDDEKRKKDEKKANEDKKEEEKRKAEEKKAKEELNKFAQRKSTLNMCEEEKAKAEWEDQERARKQDHGSGAVDKARSRFQPSEPIIPILTSNEPIVYKRSAHLEPKPVDEQRQKRVYSPIPKPEPDNGQFDKQMAELREQMKKDKRKLQGEFRDMSSGLKSAAVEAKQKAKEEEHKLLMNKATNTFGRAEEEKRRQKDLAAETEAEEKKRKELEERKGKEQRSRKEEKQEVAKSTAKRPEPKKTIRRAAKEPKVTTEDGEMKQEGSKHGPRRFGEKPETKRKTEELMKFTKEETPATPSVLQKLMEKVMEKEMGGTKPMEPIKQQQQLGVPSMKKMAVKSEEGVKKGSSKGRRRARRRSTRHGHARRPFVRTPFDIDELMGWRNLDSFERMDAFFASKGAEKRQMKAGDEGPAAKRRGTEPQKIWISELHDIDKLYKASELRDIKLSAEACCEMWLNKNKII